MNGERRQASHTWTGVEPMTMQSTVQCLSIYISVSNYIGNLEQTQLTISQISLTLWILDKYCKMMTYVYTAWRGWQSNIKGNRSVVGISGIRNRNIARGTTVFHVSQTTARRIQWPKRRRKAVPERCKREPFTSHLLLEISHIHTQDIGPTSDQERNGQFSQCKGSHSYSRYMYLCTNISCIYSGDFVDTRMWCLCKNGKTLF